MAFSYKVFYIVVIDLHGFGFGELCVSLKNFTDLVLLFTTKHGKGLNSSTVKKFPSDFRINWKMIPFQFPY